MGYTTKELRDYSRGDTDAMLDWCADEIDRLHEIVSHLPKTADGVSIYPGMKLWTIYDAGVVTVQWFYRSNTGVWMMETDRGNRTERECYSTLEAAEKARKQ